MSRDPHAHKLTAKSSRAGMLDRRALLVGGGAAAAAIVAIPLVKRAFQPQDGASVFIARHQKYALEQLETTIHDGLLATGLDPEALRDRRVLLKPNMVEPMRGSPQMTTNPVVVLAAAEVFRRWGAQVVVGEAPGHVRDTEMALEESRLVEALDAGKLPFADLNYQEVTWKPNVSNVSKLPGLFFPRAVAEADVVVSMPKLKTHHWVGLTVSLKNLYGTLPGCKYGWPKNVLHHAGIPQTVIDINAALPRTLAIVDGIDCMEGDGPILGSLKHMGLVIVGTNTTAVDATCARIMGLDPERVSYLDLARGRLGPLKDSLIQQRGERWQSVVSPFQMLDRPHLQELRVKPGELTS